MQLNKFVCTKCKKQNNINSNFCSYCGEKIISIEEWADSLSVELIKIMNDTNDIEKMLNSLGYKGKMSEKMKYEELILRLFAVNLVSQENDQDNPEELNNLIYHAIAKRLCKTEEEKICLFEKIKQRYISYLPIINSEDNQKFVDLGVIYLKNLLPDEDDLKNKVDPVKELNVSMLFALDFANFLNYLRNGWFGGDLD